MSQHFRPWGKSITEHIMSLDAEAGLNGVRASCVALDDPEVQRERAREDHERRMARLSTSAGYLLPPRRT